jgi:hypothetical protein
MLALAFTLSATAQESPSAAPSAGAVKPTSKSENAPAALPAQTPADAPEAVSATPGETAPAAASKTRSSSTRSSGGGGGVGSRGGGGYGSSPGNVYTYGLSGGGGAGLGGLSSAYSYFSTGSSDGAIPPLILRFSEVDPSANAAMEEDLNVMTRLIEKSLQRKVAAEAPDVKMGIEMLFSSASRSVRALYVEGFGACWMIKVNFPVFAAATTEPKPAQPSADSEWDRAKRELYGGQGEDKFLAQPAPKFEPEQVEALKKVLLQGLKNAAHIRNLKSSEFIAISVFGQPQVAGRTKVNARWSALAAPDTAKMEAQVEERLKAAQAQLDALQQRLTETHPASKAQQQKLDQFSDQLQKKQREIEETIKREMEQVQRKQEDIKREVEQAHHNLEQAKSSMSGLIMGTTSDAAPGTVLTIRATKADVDAFAKGKLDFEAFQKKAEVHAYPGNGYGLTSLNSWAKERTVTTRTRY